MPILKKKIVGFYQHKQKSTENFFKKKREKVKIENYRDRKLTQKRDISC